MIKRSFAVALVLALFFALSVQAQTPTAGTVNSSANLRGGPGTSFPIVGSRTEGATIQIAACNDDCSWYQLPTGEWIVAFLVTATGALPTEEEPIDTTPAPITIVGWNVESGGALQNVVSDRIAAFQDVDIWALSEVNATDAEDFEFGAEEGEGANYESYLGTTGAADRLLLIWDEDRFDLMTQGQVPEIGFSARAPLWVALRDTTTGLDFIVMVNHLHRSNDNTRHTQATMLNAWAASQTMPVIALGDYNFDWNLPNGDSDHDIGYDNMVKNGVWEWIRPAELVTTQCSGWPCGFNSVLDFVFAAGPARDWNIATEIIVTENDFPDDNTTPDHRPVMAVVMPTGVTALMPTPTSAPTAVPAATTSFTADEQSYVAWLNTLTQSYTQAFQTFSDQFTAAGETPALITTEAWQTETATAIVIIQTLSRSVREKVAPPRFAAIHAELTNAANHYDQAMDLVVEGLANLDEEKLTAAQTNMLEGNDAIKRATAALQTVTSSITIAPAATSAPTCPQANTTANIRSGPGTGYTAVSSVQQGQCLVITGRTEVGDWFQLDNGNWIAAFLVTDPGPMASIPVVIAAAPTPIPATAPTQETQQAQPTPIPPTPVPQQETAQNCDPSYPGVCIPPYPPDLDCGEISFRRFQVVGSDPHGFDGDADGIGCESN